MRRRYHRDKSDLYDFFSGLFGLTILGSLGLYFADRALFYEAVAGLCILIVLLAVATILWSRHKARKFDAPVVFSTTAALEASDVFVHRSPQYTVPFTPNAAPTYTQGRLTMAASVLLRNYTSLTDATKSQMVNRR